MGIFNIMEDKIKAAVADILEKSRDRHILVNYTEDIIAYVLNRVPSRYISSERGFMHTEINYAINTQLQADIKFCVHDAIRTLTNRRQAGEHSNFYEEISKKHYYFPFIIGEVLEESTFSVIPGIEVQLVYNDQPVSMIDDAWINPYFTCKATRGFYLFWPDFIREEMDPFGDNIFKAVFRHKKFNKKEIAFKLRAMEEYDYNKSKVIPLTLMRLKKGEEISLG